MNYTDVINPFRKNVNKISIIFNDGDRRDTIDKAMYTVNEPGVDPSQVRTNDLVKIKSDWPGNREDYAKFLRYELTTFTQQENPESGEKIKKVHRFDSIKDLKMNQGDD